MRLRTDEQKSEVRKRRIRRLELRGYDRQVITVFICWHLFALTIWAMPQSSYVVSKCMKVIRSYMTETGFAQGWLMFAPNPSALDIYVDTKIHYANGSTRVWAFPRMSQEGLIRKYRDERYRKYMEYAYQDVNGYLWPSLARYAARANYDKSANNSPVRVELIRHFRFIPPPGQPLSAFSSYSFYSEDIKPEDLR